MTIKATLEGNDTERQGHVNQIQLIGAIVDNLSNQGVTQLCPRQFNRIIASVDEIIEEINKPTKLATDGMGLEAWLASDDTGASSEYMASVLGGFVRKYAHPYDLSDFMRCSRLLRAVPEFRDNNLYRAMGSQSYQWRRLVTHWERIESLVAAARTGEADSLVRECVSDSSS